MRFPSRTLTILYVRFIYKDHVLHNEQKGRFKKGDEEIVLIEKEEVYEQGSQPQGWNNTVCTVHCVCCQWRLPKAVESKRGPLQSRSRAHNVLNVSWGMLIAWNSIPLAFAFSWRINQHPTMCPWPPSTGNPSIIGFVLSRPVTQLFFSFFFLNAVFI